MTVLAYFGGEGCRLNFFSGRQKHIAPYTIFRSFDTMPVKAKHNAHWIYNCKTEVWHKMGIYGNAGKALSFAMLKAKNYDGI